MYMVMREVLQSSCFIWKEPWNQSLGTLAGFMKIMFRAIQTYSMLIKPAETVGDAFAGENYHGEGFSLNMSEPLTAGKIIQED